VDISIARFHNFFDEFLFLLRGIAEGPPGKRIIKKQKFVAGRFSNHLPLPRVLEPGATNISPFSGEGI